MVSIKGFWIAFCLSLCVLSSAHLRAMTLDDTAAAAAQHPRFRSEIFTYANLADATGKLSVSMRGEVSLPDPETTIGWEARDVRADDTPFHQDLFADPNVMNMFGSGQVRDRGATADRVRGWIARFESGQPHGGLTIFENGDRIGHCVAGAGDRGGASEIAYASIPSSWGRGVTSSVVSRIINQWVPEVRQWGLGDGLDEKQDAHIIQAFQCFGGQPLHVVDATASPANVASWKVLDKAGFHAARSRVQNPTEPLTLEQEVELSNLQTALFNKLEQAGAVGGTRYLMFLPGDQERTVSYVPQYGKVKFHFEYDVQ